MKKLSLNANAFKKGEVLTRAQLKKVMGGNGSGSGDGHCKTGSCQLFIPDLGITVTGTCQDSHNGGSIRCYCKHNSYTTDSNQWSSCNL